MKYKIMWSSNLWKWASDAALSATGVQLIYLIDIQR